MGLYTGKIALTNARSTPMDLSSSFDDDYDLPKAVALCDSPEDLEFTANQYALDKPFTLADDTSRYTRLSTTDTWGNVRYFVAWKDDTVSMLSKVSDLALITELERRGYQIT